jgi:hypothetical protein
VFYDVGNHGRKLPIATFLGGGGLAGDPRPPSFPSLLRFGATVVWSGWLGGLLPTGTPIIAENAGIGTQSPIAHPEDGPRITSTSREEYIPSYASDALSTIRLSCPPALICPTGPR